MSFGSKYMQHTPKAGLWPPSQSAVAGRQETPWLVCGRPTLKRDSEQAEGIGTEATNGDGSNAVHCNEKVSKQALQVITD